MSLCTVTELRSVLGIGALYTDATLQETCDAADKVLLPLLWSNTYYAVGHSNQGNVGTLYFDDYVQDIFYVGQTVTVANAGAHFSGSHTITSVGDTTIQYATDHLTSSPYHPFQPYATVSATQYTNWTADAAVQQAALMISIDIWQAVTRQVWAQSVLMAVPSHIVLAIRCLVRFAASSLMLSPLAVWSDEYLQHSP